MPNLLWRKQRRPPQILKLSMCLAHRLHWQPWRAQKWPMPTSRKVPLFQARFLKSPYPFDRILKYPPFVFIPTRRTQPRTPRISRLWCPTTGAEIREARVPPGSPLIRHPLQKPIPETHPITTNPKQRVVSLRSGREDDEQKLRKFIRKALRHQADTKPERNQRSTRDRAVFKPSNGVFVSRLSERRNRSHEKHRVKTQNMDISSIDFTIVFRLAKLKAVIIYFVRLVREFRAQKMISECISDWDEQKMK